MQSLKSAIERLASLGEVEHKPEARTTFLEFREELTRGKVRAAEKKGGRWVVNAWVKQGILLGFRLGELADKAVLSDEEQVEEIMLKKKKLQLKDKMQEIARRFRGLPARP